MTNREKINAMDNTELAEFLLKNVESCEMCAFKYDGGDCVANNCVQGFRYWLESEVENEEQTN